MENINGHIQATIEINLKESGAKDPDYDSAEWQSVENLLWDFHGMDDFVWRNLIISKGIIWQQLQN